MVVPAAAAEPTSMTKLPTLLDLLVVLPQKTVVLIEAFTLALEESVVVPASSR